MHRKPLLATSLLVVGVLILAACAGGSPESTSRPGATATPTPPGVTPSRPQPKVGPLVVLGHSGATGYNSDPANPGTDAQANSWASGTNPDVRSVYSRLVAVDPAMEGRVVNAAVDGSTVEDLGEQLDRALSLEAEPGLVLIQAVDNDVRCDGTDEQNYAAFAASMTAVLQRIVTASPKARIVVMGTWATVENYTDVVAGLPSGRTGLLTGSGPCDPFDADGKKHPERMRYQQQVFDHYHQRLEAACAAVAECHYAAGVPRMKIVAEDLTSDYSHLGVAGQRKQAALVWEVVASLL